MTEQTKEAKRRRKLLDKFVETLVGDELVKLLFSPNSKYSTTPACRARLDRFMEVLPNEDFTDLILS
jgi:hypothetical protein